MDLNQLLHAHQMAAMQASEAGKAGNFDERQNQFDLISDFAKRIRLVRQQGGSPENDNPFVHGETARPQQS